MPILTDTDDVVRVLRESKTVAVLGTHVNSSKAAYYVPRYLDAENYEIYPVNPTYAGETLFDREVVDALSDLETPIDIVDIFRRSEHLPGHVDDILAMDPLPKVVWFQLGIRNDEVAEKLSAAGIEVIQDRCMLADHQRLL